MFVCVCVCVCVSQHVSCVIVTINPIEPLLKVTDVTDDQLMVAADLVRQPSRLQLWTSILGH